MTFLQISRLFIGLIFIATGLANIFYPIFAWYLKEGWKSGGYYDPDEDFLFITKFTGIIALILGLGIFIIGLLS